MKQEKLEKALEAQEKKIKECGGYCACIDMDFVDGELDKVKNVEDSNKLINHDDGFEKQRKTHEEQKREKFKKMLKTYDISRADLLFLIAACYDAHFTNMHNGALTQYMAIEDYKAHGREEGFKPYDFTLNACRTVYKLLLAAKKLGDDDVVQEVIDGFESVGIGISISPDFVNNKGFDIGADKANDLASDIYDYMAEADYVRTYGGLQKYDNLMSEKIKFTDNRDFRGVVNALGKKVDGDDSYRDDTQDMSLRAAQLNDAIKVILS